MNYTTLLAANISTITADKGIDSFLDTVAKTLPLSLQITTPNTSFAATW